MSAAGPEQARREFGGELRALRRRAGLTGDQLADRLGWSQPKVSKIETGKTMPAVADVRAYAQAAGASGQEAADLLVRFEELATQVTGWRTLLRAGIVGSQRRVAERDRDVTVLRQLASTIGVPGLLQTAEYARVMLSDGPDPASDVAAGVAARLERQEVLYGPGKSFHFVLLEHRGLAAEPSTMAVQMDRISQLSTLSSVDVSIVPLQQRLPFAPIHGFRIYDDELVTIELETGVVEVHSPADVAYYRRMFDALDEVAVHGDEARRLLAGLAEHYRANAEGSASR